MSRQFEIIVVGGGIAGLSAGLSAARLGRGVLVITGDTLGGHLITIERIDGYPGFGEGVAGYDLCPTVQEQAAEAGAEFAMPPVSSLERKDELWEVAAGPETYAAPSVILASGTRLKNLGVEGEDLLRGKGVSQCASCDAPLLRDREVVVAGGGDSALQEALTLAEHCSKVTIVHHGAALSGQKAYRDLVEASSRIVLVPDAEVAAILGTDNVTGARVRNFGTSASAEISCDAVFVFVGLAPNTAFVEPRAVGGSIVDDAGGIVTDARMRTSLPGLFAAGTVRAGSAGRAAAASGDGAVAALAADEFLEAGEWPG